MPSTSSLGLLDVSVSPPVWKPDLIFNINGTDSIPFNSITGGLFNASDGRMQVTGTLVSPMTKRSYSSHGLSMGTTVGFASDTLTALSIIDPEFQDIRFVLLMNELSATTAAAAPGAKVNGLGATNTVGEGPGGPAAVILLTHQAVIDDEFGENLKLLQMPTIAPTRGALHSGRVPGQEQQIMMQRVLPFLFSLAILLPGCGGGSSAPAAPAPAPAAPVSVLSAVAAVGEKMFNDTTLHATGRQSCASCHVPDHFHGPGNDLPVQSGGPDGTALGLRSVPSLRYIPFMVGFHHQFLPDGGDVWAGGFNRDGRSNTLELQALGVLFSAREMANTSNAQLAARLRTAPWYPEFKGIYTVRVDTDDDFLVASVLVSLARYLKEDPGFAPFDSKFDLVQVGKAAFTDAEARGLALFNDPAKGNCALCHPSGPKSGLPTLFTDSGYDNIGVPRNPLIPDNADPHFFDLGACGPFRSDEFAALEKNCGRFKAPTLRNVARRPVYFHNGAFTDLRQVVKFYVTRDVSPELWYPRGPDGKIQIYNDTPERLHDNINKTDAPYDRGPGQAPRLNDAEIDDVVAFLQTLTDGHRP